MQIKDNDMQPIWLTAFQGVLEPLFSNEEIGLDSDEEVVCAFLFEKLVNVNIQYQGNTVKEISFT